MPGTPKTNKQTEVSDTTYYDTMQTTEVLNIETVLSQTKHCHITTHLPRMKPSTKSIHRM